MGRVLLVGDDRVVPDAEQGRERLAAALAADGHPEEGSEIELDVRRVSCGRDAIDLGMRIRPDVLVTQWLLPDRIDGLHVHEALTSVVGPVQTILISEVVTADLRATARDADVYRLLELETPQEELVGIIAEAIRRPQAGAEPTIAMLEIGPDEQFVYANAPAQRLLEQTDARSLEAVFDPASRPRLDELAGGWRDVAVRGERATTWHTRCQAPRQGGGWICVLRGPNPPYVERLPLPHLLLDAADPSLPRWPYTGHALVVATSSLVRSAVVSVLARVGTISHSTPDDAEACELLRADERIDLVVLRRAADVLETQSLVNSLRAIRGDVVIACTAARPDATEDHAAVDNPLGLMEVVQELRGGRVGVCVDCKHHVMLDLPDDVEQPTETCRCGRERTV